MSASSFVHEFGSKPVNLDKACKLLDAKMKTVDACCIDGKYNDYIINMSKKLNRELKCEKLDADITVIDSYDSAEYCQTNNDRTSIFYFSSKLLNPSIVASGFYTSDSLNILPW